MNDCYLTRGKRKDNGEWEVGYYFYTSEDDKHWIWKCGEFKHEVDVDWLGIEIIGNTHDNPELMEV